MATTWRHARRPYVVRLVAWLVILNASVLVLRMMPETRVTWPTSVGHALLEVCGALIAGGGAYCLWVQYRVSTQRQMLLAATAFSGIMAGQMVHAFTCGTVLGGWHAAIMLGHQFYGLWRFGAGVLLIMAARDRTKDSKADCRRFGLRMIWGSQAASVVIVSLVILLGRAHLTTTLTPEALSVIHVIGRAVSSLVFIHALGMAAMMVGLVVFAARYMEDEDAFSDGIARCLVLALTGMGALLVSRTDYDPLWWASHVLGISALLVLLIELAREFGASYSDAQTRIEHLEAVYRVSSQLSNTLDLRVVLLVLVSDIADMVQARYAAVMLVDDMGETLRAVATHGLPESPLKSNEPRKIEGSGRPGFHSGHTARAFREKRICVVDDVFTDVEFVPWKLLARSNGYAVSVPLVYQDVALGALNLFFDAHIPINAERMRLFETLASSAAVAIANAQLYDRALEAHPSESDATNLFRMRLAS
jgi:hypothetical protein